MHINRQLSGAPITNTTPIVASVADANLDSWTLEIGDVGWREPVVIAAGFETLGEQAVGVFDPSDYRDGFYEIRLTATDIAGRTSSDQFVIEVSAKARSEHYALSDTDLALVLGNGHLLTLHSYDSSMRDVTGVLGSGWRLDGFETFLETNVPSSDISGDYGAFDRNTRVYLSTSAGRLGFEFAPQKVEIANRQYYRPAWQPLKSGMGYELASADVLLTVARGRFYELSTGLPYNPANTRISGGTAYTLSTPNGDAKLMDPQGRRAAPGAGGRRNDLSVG